MKKFSILLFIILTFNTQISIASDNIFNIECTQKTKKVFDVNMKDLSDGKLLPPTIYTFNQRKKKLIKVNFKTEKDSPIFITETRIYWMSAIPLDDGQNNYLKESFNMSDPGILIHIHDINRYTGEKTYRIYALNKKWYLKYLGLKSWEEGSSFDVDTIFTQKFLIRSTDVVEKGISITKNNIPQKEIILMADFTEQCQKKIKKKLF